ncbi:predicted protein [Uncinocarpus reesii 1704]|uniref:Uncharacterized protein n=1 Tax=Uncinocarpus reesii (strain UAMH 1704) TaxID=336963 RepID=C4JYE9_UNCRE|nr:uncharacterized protein UREG_07200 [Uncinocarpus reesii 1704]EEP82335.1 predicted protein [Uncinocarpus reesii 1704]
MGDLEARALPQFDKLVEEGSVVFKDAPPIHVSAQPYNLQFRIAPSLTKKSQIDIKEAKAQNDKPRNASNPFARDPPDFVLEHVGPDHTLRFNKFCVVRPQFVLHTNEYKPQIEPLSEADLAAGWDVLCRLDSPYMLIYNGGLQGGWSLPHRHMQLLPRPRRDTHELFPDLYGIHTGRVPNIPFRHAARMLPPSISPEQIFAIYQDLLAATGVGKPDYSHNLVLVREWMLVIPRSRAGQEGVNIANAAAMVGMIWIPSREVLDVWLQGDDPMELLAKFGKPW